MGPVFHDRRQDVGREARTAAKDGHEYGTVRARVGGKAAGGLHSMQILESSDFASVSMPSFDALDFASTLSELSDSFVAAKRFPMME